MDRRTTNVPHLLAQYLFRHAKGRKSGARLSRGHFIGRLAMHFRLVNDEGLRGLSPGTRVVAGCSVRGWCHKADGGWSGLGGRLSRALLDQADLDSPHWLITIAWDSARVSQRPLPIIFLCFTIIDDDDMTKDVVLGMKFCKKYASCQMIMKKFALGDKCEQIMEDE
ncbi:hypothetical protein Tco_1405420 [Tanacetum coccineum]